MTQRKLNPEELERVEQARHNLRGMCGWTTTDRGVDYWRGVDKELSKMLLHGTTDGKPWIEPQPEIGEGYRVATDDDEDRRDLEAWLASKWIKTGPGVCTGVTYRVPVDRIPTDEDAKQRPTVMVRNNERMKWKVVKLIMVAEKAEGIHFPFVTIDSLRPDCWACCRFPYPGELD